MHVTFTPVGTEPGCGGRRRKPEAENFGIEFAKKRERDEAPSKPSKQDEAGNDFGCVPPAAVKYAYVLWILCGHLI